MLKMKNYSLLLIFVSLLLQNCTFDETAEAAVLEEKKQWTKEDQIIDSVRVIHGSEQIDHKSISFQFRDYFYNYKRGNEGLIQSREKIEEDGRIIKDVWKADVLKRTINGEEQFLEEEDQHMYKNSINSVFYFAFLPKSLNDSAVHAELMDTIEINNTAYFKLKITFSEEGGGEDFEDIFLYWINAKEYTMDFLAYQYFTEGGGIRFRKAINRRKVEGVTFQDYINYKPKKEEQDFLQVDQAYIDGELEIVSRIKLKTISVK